MIKKNNPRSWIKAVTIPITGTKEQREAKFSGKHTGHQLFVFDEGDAIPDAVYKGAESCMSNRQAHMVVAFNPRAQIGKLWMMQEEWA